MLIALFLRIHKQWIQIIQQYRSISVIQEHIRIVTQNEIVILFCKTCNLPMNMK